MGAWGEGWFREKRPEVFEAQAESIIDRNPLRDIGEATYNAWSTWHQCDLDGLRRRLRLSDPSVPGRH